MSAVFWLAAVLVALLGFVAYLVWPWAGQGWNTRLKMATPMPKFRVRFRSLAARWLRKSASANHHFVLFGVIHVADSDLTPAQFCHEMYHVLREKKLGLAHVWRYLTSRTFRETEEREAEEFQRGWWDDPVVLSTLKLINDAGD